MNIHYLYPLKDFEIEFYEKAFGDGVHFSHGSEALGSDETTLLIGGRPSDAELTKFPNAKTIFIPYAGVPAELRELFKDDESYQIYNLHHNALNTAEFGVTMMMSVMKQVVPFHLALMKNDWGPRYAPSTGTQVISGKRVLLLGWGHISKEAARMCEGLGMHVSALNRSSENAWMDGTVKVDSIQKLDDYLPEADVLFLALPLTKETENLIDARRFGLMKSSAIVVNIARGPILKEKDFFEALENGVIAGAGIDVWYEYPKNKAAAGETAPSAFDFGKLDNVVMSPHRGANAEDYRGFTNDEIVQFVLKFAENALDAEPVDLTKGY